MDKDIAHSDPAEGARDVVERELKRQEKREAEERASSAGDKRRREENDKAH